jgi:hypothetical protein
MRHPWKHFRWWFLSRQWLSSRWWFLSLQELYALSNLRVNRGSSFVDDFWVASNSIFVDDFRVHRGSLRCEINASPLEAVLLMISRMIATQFSLMILESTGVVCAVESMCHPWKQFCWWFLSPRDCLRCRIHTSPVEAVSLMISESRGTVCVVDFMRYGFETWKLVFWATPRKKTSENSWKHVSVIQRSDQMLCSFWAFILVCRVHTSSSPSSDSIATP